MKLFTHFFFLSFFYAAFFFSPKKSMAQASFYIQDSSYFEVQELCNFPDTAIVHIVGTLNISTQDSTEVVIDWGNGLIESYFVQLDSLNWNTTTYDTTLQYVYPLPGYYTARLSVYHSNYTSMANETEYNIISSTQCIDISGYVWKDETANCSLDSNEQKVSNVSVVVKDSAGDIVNLGITDSLGNYSFHVPESQDSFYIQAQSLGALSISCPANLPASFLPTTNQTFNYGLDCNPNSFDRYNLFGSVNIGTPGNTGSVRVYTGGRWCFTDSMKTILILDSHLIYEDILSGPQPNFVSADSLVWYHDSLSSWSWPYNQYTMSWGGSRSVLVRFTTNTNSTFQDSTTIRSYVSLDSGEYFINNNSKVQKYRIQASYDPNNKEVTPQGIDEEGFVPNGTRFTYTINFQNTGTAPADHVFIMDTIDQNLDLSTIQIHSTSHAMQPYFYDGKTIKFDFQNIGLPDSASNEPLSHGYVTYSISAHDDLPERTKIENTAYIYFDYNEPIITNTTLNTIDTTTTLAIGASIRDVTCLGNDNGAIFIHPTGGKPPYYINWENGSSEDTLVDLSAGTYAITLTDAAEDEQIDSLSVEENRMYDDPVIGELIGPSFVDAWKAYEYEVSPTLGSEYSWQVEGGEILESNNNFAEILWHAGPNGRIIISEQDSNGCINDTSSLTPVAFVGTNELYENGINIYPNPAVNTVNIELSERSSNASLRAYDLQGRQVFQQELTSKNNQINISDLPSGVYAMVIELNSKIFRTNIAVN
ncbi:MAG: T9SS type A sorting domain-containing protein [Salibacteraceae bacterium]